MKRQKSNHRSDAGSPPAGSNVIHLPQDDQDTRYLGALERIFFALATEPEIVIDHDLADDLFLSEKFCRITEKFF